jgi:arsenate reductase
MARVLFVCLQNARRSQTSEALLERAPAVVTRARRAATTPTPRMHPEVVEVMPEVSVDLSGRVPQKLSRELAENSRHRRLDEAEIGEATGLATRRPS